MHPALFCFKRLLLPCVLAPFILFVVGCGHKGGSTGSIDPKIVGKWASTDSKLSHEEDNYKADGTYVRTDTGIGPTQIGMGVYTTSNGTVTRQLKSVTENGQAIAMDDDIRKPDTDTYTIAGDVLTLSSDGISIPYQREN